MRQIRETGRQVDRVILLFLFALFLFVSPLIGWWASDDSTWYLVYLLWLVLIVLGVLVQRGRPSDDF
ncbi:MAG: UTP--glucose-1-phosphate uridylyltransferase [Gammaproteobacteria bacterium]